MYSDIQKIHINDSKIYNANFDKLEIKIPFEKKNDEKVKKKMKKNNK